MVYHYNSIWLHLYVPYVRQILEMRDPGLDIRTAFARSTDGEQCPISRVYRPEEFARPAEDSGFRCRFLGAAIAIYELEMLQHRYRAIQDLRLAPEHRRFLIELTLDPFGRPWHGDVCAGVDGCYELTLDR